jgi:hypothetical protein
MADSCLDLTFPSVGGRDVSIRFHRGEMTSDAGLLLVAQADRKAGVSQALVDAMGEGRQEGN